MSRLEGKVAIITGGSGGMGETHARRFVKEGAKVVIADIQEDKGKTLANELGEQAIFIKLDVTNYSNWEEVVQLTEDTFGPVNILVNNAGIAPGDTIRNLDLDTYHQVIKINQDGCVYGMKAVYPSMKKGETGSIINVSSISGLVAAPYTSSYTTSKFALRGVSKAAAIEYASDNIRVNSVHPGTIATEMLENLDAESEEMIEGLKARIPLGRLAESDEITNLVLFLASDEASYCTGSEFIADGGLTTVM